MATKFWILVIFSCLASLSLQKQFPKEDGVLVLTPDTFGKAYKQYNQLIIEYYAPWCGQCKNFAPQYIQLVKLLDRLVPGLTLAKLDCEAHGEFCKQQAVTNYPTIIYYDNGTERTFDGKVSTESIMDWINGLEHPIEFIDNYARLHHRRKKNDHSIVLVAKHDSRYADMFKQLSIEIPEFKWFHYFGEESKLLPLHPPRVLINNSESENIIIELDKLKEKEKIKENIDIHRYPKLKRYEDPAISAMIFERNKPALMYVADTNATYQKDKKALDELNEKYYKTSPVVIFIKESVGKDADRFLTYFGINKYPFVLYIKQIKLGDMKKHYFRGQISVKELSEFIEQATNGKLEQDYKSEEKPLKNDGPVMKLVGSDFRDVVNNDRDVIVTYSMPNCSICDVFVPTFEEVAVEFKKAGSNLLFASINNKDNDSGVYTIGYPTIKLHKRSASSQPVDFIDKDRTKAQLLTFLSREGFKLTQPKPDTTSAQSQKPATNEKEAPNKDSQKQQADSQVPKIETKKPEPESQKTASQSSQTASPTKATDTKSTSSTSKTAQDSGAAGSNQKTTGQAKKIQK